MSQSESIGAKLEAIRDAELSRGNSVTERLIGFSKCRVIVVLKQPFHTEYPTGNGVHRFESRDTHYPMGVGYKDDLASAAVLAPFER